MRFAIALLLSGTVLFGADVLTGKWSSDNNGNGGAIRLTLKPEPNVVFTLDNQDVRTTSVRAKTQGQQFEISYDFELQGYKLRSTITGTLTDGKLDAKYVTRNLDD